jgi:hypothetical protein
LECSATPPILAVGARAGTQTPEFDGRSVAG